MEDRLGRGSRRPASGSAEGDGIDAGSDDRYHDLLEIPVGGDVGGAYLLAAVEFVSDRKDRAAPGGG